MSTACAIGRQLPDGTVEANRCHWDGYPAGVGVILGDAYRRPDQIAALLALGDLSSLGRKLTPEAGEHHSFTRPASDVVVAYHRDRGEPLKPPVPFRDADDFLNHGQDEMEADYLYLFADGEWLLVGPKGTVWRLLSDDAESNHGKIHK